MNRLLTNHARQSRHHSLLTFGAIIRGWRRVLRRADCSQFSRVMMFITRQEFIERRDKQRKISGIWSIVLLLLMFGPVCFMAWLEPRRHDLPAHVWTFLSYTTIFLIFGVLASIYINTWRLTRRFGVCCPECKKSVMQMQALVIATGRCGHCGGRVLDDAT